MLEFCPACDAALPRGAAFCEECGAPAPGAPPVTRGRSPAAQEERRAARQELLLVRRRVETLRLTYTALGVVFGLFLLLFASWWWRFSTRGWSGTGLVQVVRLAAVFSAVDAALMLACRRYVRRSPVVLGSIGAALVSVSTGLLLLGFPWATAGPLLLGVLALRLVLNLSLWALLPAAARLQRLLAEHPELERAPRAPGEPRPPAAPPVSWRRALLLGGPGLAVLLLGWWQLRPPGPEALASAFERAWATGDPQQVGELFEGSTRAGPWLRRRVGAQLPRLQREELEVRGPGARVTFVLEGMEEALVVQLRRSEDGSWRFTEMGLR